MNIFLSTINDLPSFDCGNSKDGSPEDGGWKRIGELMKQVEERGEGGGEGLNGKRKKHRKLF